MYREPRTYRFPIFYEEYRILFHCCTLYACGSSLEDAYIGLAYKVHMFFDDEGDEIPDVGHVKSYTEIRYDTLLDDTG